MVPKIHLKVFDNEGNELLIPVTEDDIHHFHASGYKPAESYADARKRNLRAQATKRFLGSVLLYGRS